MPFDATAEELYHPVTGELIGTVPAAPASSEAVPPSAPPKANGNFNAAAAGKVYSDAGTLKGGILGFNPDIDETIKASSVETNLGALAAGYKGTGAENSVVAFKDVILAYPELAKAADGMLKNEGEHVLGGMKEILTGNGAINMDDFKKAMEKPENRALVADMFDKVATNEFGMEYAVEFTKDAMAAMKDPMKNGQKFLDTAKKAGIDTSALEKQAGNDAFLDLLKEPKNGIFDMMSQMDMGFDLKAGLSSILSGLAGFFKEAFGHFLIGDNEGPGAIEIFKNGWSQAVQSGTEEYARRGVTPPPAGAGAPAAPTIT